MDAVQVESMLAEAGLTKNNARILFRHLNQFLGKEDLSQSISNVPFLSEMSTLQL
jgi:hypothetical protein